MQAALHVMTEEESVNQRVRRDTRRVAGACWLCHSQGSLRFSLTSTSARLLVLLTRLPNSTAVPSSHIMDIAYIHSYPLPMSSSVLRRSGLAIAMNPQQRGPQVCCNLSLFPNSGVGSVRIHTVCLFTNPERPLCTIRKRILPYLTQ